MFLPMQPMFIFVNSYTSCCWILLSRYGGGSWRISTKVTPTRRSDNGRINSSPVSRSPAIVRWSEGCPLSLRIPVEDADGDVVKCRYADHSESSIYNDSFPYGTLDEVINHFYVTLFFIRMLFFPTQVEYFSLLFCRKYNKLNIFLYHS